VTIKQLTNATRDASTDTYQIDNADLATVRIMGLVETVEEHATNCNYRINDGTGILECKYWIEKDSSGSRHTKIKSVSPSPL
jgi:replication factor A2